MRPHIDFRMDMTCRDNNPWLRQSLRVGRSGELHYTHEYSATHRISQCVAVSDAFFPRPFSRPHRHLGDSTCLFSIRWLIFFVYTTTNTLFWSRTIALATTTLVRFQRLLRCPVPIVLDLVLHRAPRTWFSFCNTLHITSSFLYSLTPRHIPSSHSS